jgi:WD40-like Beta Propeller Repeat
MKDIPRENSSWATNGQQTRPPLCLLCLSFRLQASDLSRRDSTRIAKASCDAAAADQLHSTHEHQRLRRRWSELLSHLRSPGLEVAFSSSCDLIPGKNSNGNREVFVMNFDGSGLVQLTSTTGGIGAIHPEIDSSGQKMVFASDRDMISGGNTVYGGGGPGGNVDPRFNAGATKIIFGSDRDLISGGNTDENGELFEMNSNGSALRQLTHTTGGCGNGEPTPGRDPVAGSNTDRTDMVQLTNAVNPAGIGSVAPHWTPDTNTIVFRGDGVI